MARIRRAAAAAVAHEARNRSRDMVVFQKTRLCKFFARGECARGTDCSFAHCQQELLPKPDFHHTRMCPDLVATGACAAGESCKFAHCEEQLRRATLNKGGRCAGRREAAVGGEGKQAAFVQHLAAMKQHVNLLESQVHALGGPPPVAPCPVAVCCDVPWPLPLVAGGPPVAPLPGRGAPVSAPAVPGSQHKTWDSEGESVSFSRHTTGTTMAHDFSDDESLWTPSSCNSPRGTVSADSAADTLRSVRGSASEASSEAEREAEEEEEEEEQEDADEGEVGDLTVQVKNTFLHVERWGAHPEARHRAHSVPVARVA